MSASFFDKEFKLALASLPSKEKDKLILRLLKKDLKLAERLYFDLVSETTSEEFKNNIEQKIPMAMTVILNNYYSPGYLQMDIREVSGKINEYFSITKDKYGEIELSLLLLVELLKKCGSKINLSKHRSGEKLRIYIVSKIFKVLILISKQHDDIKWDFKESVEHIGKLIDTIPLLHMTAHKNGLQLEWLREFDIPNEIESIAKALRRDGKLR